MNSLPIELVHLIYDFLFTPVMRLKSWVDESELCWIRLSHNRNAVHLLEKNPDKIYWAGLSMNPSDRAVSLLEKNPDKIHWGWLSSNPNDRAVSLLEKNPDKIQIGRASCRERVKNSVEEKNRKNKIK